MMTYSEHDIHSNSDGGTTARLLFLALFSVFLFRSPVAAQTAQGIEIAPTVGNRIEADAGAISTGALRIRSSLAVPVRGSVILELPPGWRPFMGEGTLTIGPGTEETHLFSFSVPASTPAGSYEIAYYLISGETGGQLARLPFVVHVLPRLGIQATMTNAPRSVVAGDPFYVTFQITNTSNRESRLQYEIRSVPNLGATADPPPLILAPGESRELEVVVQTEADIFRPFRHVTELIIWLESNADVRSQASALVSVMPVNSFESETIAFPFQLTLRNTGENQQSGSQAELYGAGSLAGSPNSRYELLLRGPDNRTQSLFGWRDEYRASFDSPGFEVVAGDQPFRLSTLTELGRYAFGVKSRVTSGDLRVGAFANKTRWSPADVREAGGFASYRVAPQARVGVNYLHKEEGIGSDILTAQGAFGLLDLADLEVELGGSRAPGKEGAGVAVGLRSRPGWLQYDAQFLHAQPTFTGYYQNFNARYLNLSVHPVGLFRVEGFYRMERRGLDLDPVLLHAPENTTLQAGVGYGSYAAAYYKIYRQRDRLPMGKYDREDHVLVMRFNAPYRSGSVFANMDIGQTKELILGKSYPLSRFSLAARFQPNADQGFHMSIEYSSTKDLFTDLTRQGVSWNISAWFRLTSALNLRAGFYESWTIAPLEQRNRLADASVEYTLPFQHRISAIARVNQIEGGLTRTNVAYTVEYTIPFSLSFTSTPAGGSVDGRVTDEETGAGLAGVILRAGDQVAVTGDDGSFEFPNLREGAYAITLDRGVLGPERITREVLPADIQITEGLHRHLEVVVTTAASIRGNVVRMPEAEDQERQPVPLQGVLVEVSNRTETYRAMTDGRGAFHFGDLRPGTWELTILESGVPNDLGLETPVQTITLLPGLKAETRINLVPVRKRIRMLQEGKLLHPEEDLRSR